MVILWYLASSCESDRWCDSLLSLAVAGERVVALDEDPELATGSIPLKDPLGKCAISGEDALMPLARLCSSNCFIPGNGNNLESEYLDMSAGVAGGIGETPLGGKPG